MLGHREFTLRDYAVILRRRLWLILISLVASLGAALAISFAIPPQFLSQTLVIVQHQKIPEDYVKPVVTEDLNNRLASMKEQILSRSRLEPIIERFSLFANNKNSMDERVELTRKAIKVSPISGVNRMPGFYISFQAGNPHIAQRVCAEITSLFVSESLNAREQSAEGTTAFLSQQLADAKRTLDEQDAKLASFQQKYVGRLPGQEQSNLNNLQALTAQLEASTQALNRAQQDETLLEAVIAQQTTELERSEPASSIPVDNLQDQLKTLLSQKRELESLYTPDHPDVLALDRKIADKQKAIAATTARPVTPVSPTASRQSDPPALRQSRAQLRALQQSVSALKLEQVRLAQQVQRYEARIESSPLVEAEFKQITRDHETALQFYNTLLVKMNESSMATNLERHQQGEQFQVLDSANLPEQPSFPNRRLFAGAGLAGGLCIGLFLAMLLEYLDKTLRCEADVFAFTTLPTLAAISQIDLAHPEQLPSSLPLKGILEDALR